MMPLAQRISRELLPYVEKPAQYIGGELNQLLAPGDRSGARGSRTRIGRTITHAILAPAGHTHLKLVP
jgi:hypothetical protein